MFKPRFSAGEAGVSLCRATSGRLQFFPNSFSSANGSASIGSHDSPRQFQSRWTPSLRALLSPPRHERRTERWQVESVYGVLIPGREEGFYLLADLLDAEYFAWAVRDNRSVTELSEELLYPFKGIEELIEAGDRGTSPARAPFRREAIQPAVPSAERVNNIT